MKVKTIALVLGGSLVLAGVGVGAVACSSSSSGGNNPGVDSGMNNPDTSSTGMPDNFAPPVDGNMPMNDAGVDAPAACKHGNAPTLHPSDGGPGELWCGYLSGDAGKLYCNPGSQTCCNGGTMGSGFADPVCGTPGTACANGTGPEEFDCEDQKDCPNGGTCCFGGNTIALDPACNYDYAHASGSYTRCVSPDAGGACAAGTEETLCTSSAECANVAGKPNCTPFKVIFYGLGHCTP
jgi:hypothetical protein